MAKRYAVKMPFYFPTAPFTFPAWGQMYTAVGGSLICAEDALTLYVLTTDTPSTPQRRP